MLAFREWLLERAAVRRGGDNGYAGDSSVDEEVITFLAPFFIRSGSPKVDTV